MREPYPRLGQLDLSLKEVCGYPYDPFIGNNTERRGVNHYYQINHFLVFIF